MAGAISGASAPNQQTSVGKHHHAKSADKIPPGLAKKQAEQLPDGNPWKAVLANREQQTSDNQQTAQNLSEMMNTLQQLLAELESQSQAAQTTSGTSPALEVKA